jgi:F-type H+-transporting ATPase subunit alpha
LFNKGIRPALDVGISVSRVGSSAQTKAMKKVAGKIRLELAQFRELEAFMQFASDLDDETKARIESGRKYVELLKQPQNAPVPFYKQVVAIYAANHGMFEGAPVENTRQIEASFLEFMERDRNDILDSIEEGRELTDSIIENLNQAIMDYREAHPSLYALTE